MAFCKDSSIKNYCWFIKACNVFFEAPTVLITVYIVEENTSFTNKQFLWISFFFVEYNP